MKKTIEIPVESIRPVPAAVLKTQGIPLGTVPPPRVKKLYESAEELYLNLSVPIGIMEEISIDEFAGIYSGAGYNAVDTPLEHTFPRARNLALLAFTL
ncbi:MAG: hypothetical protein GY757_16025, partial [bacterium]|nr:hypothetical protein [bacterium]